MACRLAGPALVSGEAGEQWRGEGHQRVLQPPASNGATCCRASRSPDLSLPVVAAPTALRNRQMANYHRPGGAGAAGQFQRGSRPLGRLAS